MLPFQLKRSLLYLCFIAPKLRNNRLHNSLYKAIHDISSQDKCFTYNIVLTSYGAQLISILCLVRYSIMRKMSRIDLRLFHQVSMSLSVRYNYNYPFEFVFQGNNGGYGPPPSYGPPTYNPSGPVGSGYSGSGAGIFGGYNDIQLTLQLGQVWHLIVKSNPRLWPWLLI